MFLTELCAVLDVPQPDPAGDPLVNYYVFERVVKEQGRDGTISSRRIDLYKRDSFVLEAKQSRQQKGGDKEVLGQADLFVTETASRGKRSAGRTWDVLMLNARRQAEDYVRLLPNGHEPSPFVIVCDVGHCFEVYANFRRDGKAFDQFPDRQIFRIYLEDLRNPEIRDRFTALNKARAREEQSGQVRWLRPDYQVPRFGSVKEKAELDLLGADISQTAATGPKPNYPNDDLEQVYAVMAVLSRATAPMDANTIALTFKQGRKVAAKITAVLEAGLRYGDLNSTDGGRTYRLRRAA